MGTASESSSATADDENSFRAFIAITKLVAHRGGRLFVVAFVLSAAIAALTAGEVLLLREAIARIEQEQFDAISLIILGAVIMARRIAGSAVREIQWPLSERLERSVTLDVYRSAIRAPFDEFEQASFQDALQRSLTTTSSRLWTAVWALVTIVTGSLTLAALSLVVARTAPKMLLLILASGALLFLIGAAKGRFEYQFRYHNTPSDRERRYLGSALTSRSEGKELRLNGTAGRVLNRYDHLFAVRLRLLQNLVLRRVVYDAVGAVGGSLVLIASLGFLSYEVTKGSLGIADAAAAAFAIYLLASQIQTTTAATSSLVGTALHFRDLREFLVSWPAIPTATANPDSVDLHLAHVGYQYEEASMPALDDINLTINQGEFLAIVGPNGSGKSTLLKILAGLYTPTVGSFSTSVEGVAQPVQGPLTGTATATFQDFAKYELSVQDNILMGSASETHGLTVDECLRAVGLTKPVEELPDGVHTRLGKKFANGVDLSIGQWQRLAVARSILAQTPIVLLDEPTSSTDAAGEEQFFSSLRSHFPGNTIVLVSHRFSSVRCADRILVLVDGSVAEEGSHQDLLKTPNGVYAAMFRIQAESLLGTNEPELP